jgi:hypothetical protein
MLVFLNPGMHFLVLQHTDAANSPSLSLLGPTPSEMTNQRRPDNPSTPTTNRRYPSHGRSRDRRDDSQRRAALSLIADQSDNPRTLKLELGERIRSSTLGNGLSWSSLWRDLYIQSLLYTGLALELRGERSYH